jgi:hypothetical protein
MIHNTRKSGIIKYNISKRREEYGKETHDEIMEEKRKQKEMFGNT